MSFVDTNVLVAARLPSHPHHEACHARLLKLQASGGSCAAHSLAEAYTTLTHVSRYGIPPADALKMIEETSSLLTIVSLSASEYMQTIKAAAAAGLSGPIIYDALLIACARKVGARRIYTNNVKHFQQVAPDLAPRIVEL